MQHLLYFSILRGNQKKQHMDFYLKGQHHYFKGNLLRLFFFISICTLSVNNALAQGDLLVFPKRLVFEGRSKTEQINLANTGKETSTYNVSFVEFRMNEAGGFEEIKEPDLGQQFATPFLRVYPRQVTLAPNESQTVKVQLVNTGELEVGEYRSHLYFRAVKNTKPLGQEKMEGDTNALSVKIETVFGVSIATIIRKGDSDTAVTISALEYENKEDLGTFLHFNINRIGNMSAYGDITISYMSTQDKWYEVGKIKGIGVYTPGTLRKNKILLQKPAGVNFNGGKFKVVYTSNEGTELIAEKELDL